VLKGIKLTLNDSTVGTFLLFLHFHIVKCNNSSPNISQPKAIQQPHVA